MVDVAHLDHLMKLDLLERADGQGDMTESAGGLASMVAGFLDDGPVEVCYGSAFVDGFNAAIRLAAVYVNSPLAPDRGELDEAIAAMLSDVAQSRASRRAAGRAA